MTKKYKSTLVSWIRRLKTVPVVLSVIVIAVAGTSVSLAWADTLQQQIDSLNGQNAQAQSNLSALQLQASSYQDAINKLQQQISAIQGAIAASEAQQASLQEQIDQDQTEIAQQKVVLGEDIKAMYVNGQMSTIEELATSKSLSDFVDAQTYAGAVQNKIQNTLSQIAQLEDQLEVQKTQVEQLLQTQQQQQAQLDDDESQQNQLLGMNQDQQTTYNQQIQSNNAQLSTLYAEQAAINAQYAGNVKVAAAPGGGACDPPSIDEGNGGYPWCNAPFTFDSSPTDPNGFPERQCTSFAYWYFTSVEGKTLNNNLGNAGEWWYTANRPVDQTPEVGAIGVEPENAPPHNSPFGHVMIVLATPGTTYEGALPYTSQADGISVDSTHVLVMSMNEDEYGDFMIQTWPASTLYYIH